MLIDHDELDRARAEAIMAQDLEVKGLLPREAEAFAVAVRKADGDARYSVVHQSDIDALVKWRLADLAGQGDSALYALRELADKVLARAKMERLEKTPEEYANEGVALVLDECALIGKSAEEKAAVIQWFDRYHARRKEIRRLKGTLPAEALVAISTTK